MLTELLKQYNEQLFSQLKSINFHRVIFFKVFLEVTVIMGIYFEATVKFRYCKFFYLLCQGKPSELHTLKSIKTYKFNIIVILTVINSLTPST